MSKTVNITLTDKEQELVRFLQESIPLAPEPYAEIAAKLGMSQAEVAAKIQQWLDEGTIRRYGAMVRHQRLGYKANSMTAWDVPEERAEEVGKSLAEASEVSHCYLRPKAHGWNFNVFAMIHGASEEECHEMAAKLAERVKIETYSLLFSSQEFKKISMKYFIE